MLTGVWHSYLMRNRQCGQVGTRFEANRSFSNWRWFPTLLLALASLTFASGSTCMITVDYTASLGPGGVNNGSRTFGGSVGVINLSQVHLTCRRSHSGCSMK